MSLGFCGLCGLEVQNPSARFCSECGGPLVGSTLGRFEVRALLGEGSAGRIFRAFDSTLDRLVAVRQLGVGTGALEAVESYSHLQHHNLVQIFDLQAGMTPLLVEEWVDGPSFTQLVDQADLAPEQAVFVFDGAVEGVEYLHGSGLIHGNLEPNNVLVNNDAVAKLSDAGLGSLHHAGDISADYFAPEQLSSGNGSAQSDVYSLGKLLALAVYGTELDSATGTRYESLDRLIEQATTSDIDRRIASATEFRERLDEASKAGFGDNWREVGAAGAAATVGAAIAAGVGIVPDAAAAATALFAQSAGTSAAIGAASTGAAGAGVAAAGAGAAAAGAGAVAASAGGVAAGTAAGTAAAGTAAAAGGAGFLGIAGLSAPVAAVTAGVTAVAVGAGAYVVTNRDTAPPVATQNVSAVMWGANASGQLGTGKVSTKASDVPVSLPMIGPLQGKSLLSADTVSDKDGIGHTCVVTSDGEAFCWGDNSHGQLLNVPEQELKSQQWPGRKTEDEPYKPITTPTAVSLPAGAEDVKWSQVSVGEGTTCLLDTEGNPYCGGQRGNGGQSIPLTKMESPKKLRTIQVGPAPAMAVCGISGKPQTELAPEQSVEQSSAESSTESPPTEQSTADNQESPTSTNSDSSATPNEQAPESGSLLCNAGVLSFSELDSLTESTSSKFKDSQFVDISMWPLNSTLVPTPDNQHGGLQPGGCATRDDGQALCWFGSNGTEQTNESNAIEMKVKGQRLLSTQAGTTDTMDVSTYFAVNNTGQAISFNGYTDENNELTSQPLTSPKDVKVHEISSFVRTEAEVTTDKACGVLDDGALGCWEKAPNVEEWLGELVFTPLGGAASGASFLTIASGGGSGIALGTGLSESTSTSTSSPEATKASVKEEGVIRVGHKLNGSVTGRSSSGGVTTVNGIFTSKDVKAMCELEVGPDTGSLDDCVNNYRSEYEGKTFKIQAKCDEGLVMPVDKVGKTTSAWFSKSFEPGPDDETTIWVNQETDEVEQIYGGGAATYYEDQFNVACGRNAQS